MAEEDCGFAVPRILHVAVGLMDYVEELRMLNDTRSAAQLRKLERTLSMREVGGSKPPLSIAFFLFFLR